MNNNKYPNYQKNISRHLKEAKTDFIKKTLKIAVIITGIITLLILSLLFSKWFIYITESVILVGLTVYVIRHRHLKWIRKALSIIGILAIFLFAIDIVSGSFLWSVRYVGPSLINVCVVIVALAILFKKEQWDEYVPIQLMILVISMSYIGLSFVLGIITASFALLCFIGAWIRRGSAYNRVIARMMHI